MQGDTAMNYERMILEMFERIIKLEEKVSLLEKNQIPTQTQDNVQDEYKMSKKYRYLSSYLQERDEFSIKLTFNEIEKILQFKLADSAKKHKEFWANSTSHSIALSWLSVGYRTVQVSLEDEFVVFEKNTLPQNPHTQFWTAFNDYAKKDGRLLKHFTKLYNVTYESRYELTIGKNHTHIAFIRSTKEKILSIEFYTRDKKLFDVIYGDKYSIEAEAGELEWLRLDGKLATRIRLRKLFNDSVDNQTMFNWLIEKGIQFKGIFGRYV